MYGNRKAKEMMVPTYFNTDEMFLVSKISVGERDAKRALKAWCSRWETQSVRSYERQGGEG